MNHPAHALELTASTQVVAVIGHPVRHSLSPLIHNAGFAASGLDWAYVALDVAEGDGTQAVEAARTLGFRGLSVTMPHKAAAARAVDELSPTAAALGAVNCVTNRQGHLVGDNTDGAGFVRSLQAEVGFEAFGRRCVVFGAGGAARAIVLALAMAGAGEITVVNRTVARAEAAVALAPDVTRIGTADAVAGADLVVNATPLGMAGVSVGPPDAPTSIPMSELGPGQVVADLVYHPARTELMARAEAGGATVVGGLGMLVHQAALAFTLWTGVAAPLAAMQEAAAAGLRNS